MTDATLARAMADLAKEAVAHARATHGGIGLHAREHRLEREREMEYFVEPEEAFTRDEIE